ncbi:MAG: DUF2927 domain-containing protein [Rhodobacteraceae bacterium]|nr:DUF2927 domain-containing protein [Paracoccaceae bacterium]
MVRNFLAMGAAAILLAGCVGETGSVAPPAGGGVMRSNAVIAEEFLALVFETEGGVRIPRLLKYEAPVRVALDPALAAYREDLNQVLTQIRRAGVDIALTTGTAQIRIEQVPAAVLKRYYPSAACVVVPGVSGFANFQRGRFPRWSRQMRLTRAAIFIPDDAPPYIVRACLNEEIAQALGPVNDLYSVSDTVFNDDNVFNTLTGYDLLILRLLYSPDLANGMGKANVRTRLPALLARFNPVGEAAVQGAQARRENLRWKEQIESAQNRTRPRAARISAATRAIEMARSYGDHRLVHALQTYGRLVMRARPDLAAPAFAEAYALAQRLLGPQNLRTALAAMHMAAIAVEAGRFNEVLTLTTPALATAQRYRDPIMQAGLQSLRALAFTRLGQNAAAEKARLDSLAQARYAYGNNMAQIAKAEAQIQGLLPDNN